MRNLQRKGTEIVSTIIIGTVIIGALLLVWAFGAWIAEAFPWLALSIVMFGAGFAVGRNTA